MHCLFVWFLTTHQPLWVMSVVSDRPDHLRVAIGYLFKQSMMVV